MADMPSQPAIAFPISEAEGGVKVPLHLGVASGTVAGDAGSGIACAHADRAKEKNDKILVAFILGIAGAS